MQNHYTIVELNWSASSFVCGWYFVVLMVFNRNKLPTATKKLNLNWGPLSAGSFDEIPNLITQYSEKEARDCCGISHLCSYRIRRVSVPLCLEKDALITLLGFWQCPVVSIATYVRGACRNNSLSCRFSFHLHWSAHPRGSHELWTESCWPYESSKPFFIE